MIAKQISYVKKLQILYQSSNALATYLLTTIPIIDLTYIQVSMNSHVATSLVTKPAQITKHWAAD